MAKLLAAFCILAAAWTGRADAGFRSPESLIRNVYAWYGDGSPGLSGGLPRDAATAQQFFDGALQAAWVSAKPPFDFLVQATSWKLGAVSATVLHRQYDRTYVAVSFNNSGRAITLNFILVSGPTGWLIADVESPHDSLRAFLTQHRP